MKNIFKAWLAGLVGLVLIRLPIFFNGYNYFVLPDLVFVGMIILGLIIYWFSKDEKNKKGDKQ